MYVTTIFDRSKPLKERMDRLENMAITDMLSACDNNKSKAARKLGISREALRKKMMRFKNKRYAKLLK